MSDWYFFVNCNHSLAMDTELLGKNLQKHAMELIWPIGYMVIYNEEYYMFTITYTLCATCFISIKFIINIHIWTFVSKEPIVKHLLTFHCSKLSYHLASQGERETSHASPYQLDKYQPPFKYNIFTLGKLYYFLLTYSLIFFQVLEIHHCSFSAQIMQVCKTSSNSVNSNFLTLPFPLTH